MSCFLGVYCRLLISCMQVDNVVGIDMRLYTQMDTKFCIAINRCTFLSLSLRNPLLLFLTDY